MEEESKKKQKKKITKPIIRVQYDLGQNTKNNPESNLFNNLLKKHYKVIITDKNPDFIFYSFVNTTGIRKSIPRDSLLRKFLSFIRQNISKIPFFNEILYELSHEKSQMPELKTNATRIFYTSVNCKPDMSKTDWAFTFDYDSKINPPRHMRLPYYKFEGRAGKNLIKHIDIEKIKREKTKFCAFIYSNNVPFRNNFFKKLSKYKHIDAPGNSMRNMPAFGAQKNRKQRFIPGYAIGDWQKEKIEFLKHYKFVISFENTSYPGYTTEKIYHPMLANCIPIYWGNPEINRDFNTRSFLNYHDFEKQVKSEMPRFMIKIPVFKQIILKLIIQPTTIKRLIKKIIEIDKNPELYEQYLKQPWYPENKPTKFVEDELIEKRLIEIIESRRKSTINLNNK